MNAKTLFTRVLPFEIIPATECHLVVRSKAISKHNWPILHPVMIMMMMMMMMSMTIIRRRGGGAQG